MSKSIDKKVTNSENQRNKLYSPRIERLKRYPLVLIVHCDARVPVKLLNGAVIKGTHMLKLDRQPFTHKGAKKPKYTDSYFPKELRGAVKHTVYEVTYKRQIEVCHTMEERKTQKEQEEEETDPSKKGKKPKPPLIEAVQLYQGFHFLGECAKEGNSCIVLQIFGMRGQESIISFSVNPIVQRPTQETAEFVDKELQQVHTAMEYRHAAAFGGKPLQDFSERYFSGKFCFEIDVTLCTPEQLGLLATACSQLKRLGRGYNAGYGQIKVQKLQLVRRQTTKGLVWDDKEQGHVVKTQTTEKVLKNELDDALDAWNNYNG